MKNTLIAFNTILGIAIIGIYLFSFNTVAIPSKPNLDAQCDEFKLNDKHKTIIKVCQDWDTGTEPSDLRYNLVTKTYTLEVK